MKRLVGFIIILASGLLTMVYTQVDEPGSGLSAPLIEEQVDFQKKQIAELIEMYPDVFYFWNDGLDPVIMPAEKAINFFNDLKPELIVSNNWWDWKKKGENHGFRIGNVQRLS